MAKNFTEKFLSDTPICMQMFDNKNIYGKNLRGDENSMVLPSFKKTFMRSWSKSLSMRNTSNRYLVNGGTIMAEDKKNKMTEPEQAAPKAEAPKKDDPIAIPDTDITESQLKELKKQYKRIFVTDYVDKRYVWHRLNRRTFSDICDATQEIEDEDKLINEREKRFCKACILFPAADVVEADVEDDVMASKLAREILYRSGFFPPTTTEV